MDHKQTHIGYSRSTANKCTLKVYLANLHTAWVVEELAAGANKAGILGKGLLEQGRRAVVVLEERPSDGCCHTGVELASRVDALQHTKR